ncbi:unnamed protein product [Orchesella dallaii]|uniref:Uncharacterized protein n=1 Tax=Orchesella dallaii TaxID=48710 RepID=A0ABP1QT56_9HEXA
MFQSSFGNGTYPPHMQSSLSPQGFGLYNSNGGGSNENSTSTTSCLSPLSQQTVPRKDYLISNTVPHDVMNARGDGLWNATGNENFTTFSTSGGSRVNGVSENGSGEAMRRADGGFGGSFPKPQEHPLSHSVPTTTMPQPPYQSQHPKQYAPNETEPRISQRPNASVPTIRAAGALGQKDFSSGSSINGNRGNQWVMPSMFDGENSSHETVNSSTAPPRFLPQSELSGVSGFGIPRSTNGKALLKSQIQQPYYHQNNNATNNTSARNSRSEDPELDRDTKKDRLIDSLSNSDMITCLPGFKKRPDQIKHGRQNWPKTFSEDKVPQQILRSPAVPSAYSRQSPPSISPILNYGTNRQSDGRAYSNNNGPTMSDRNQVAGGSRPCSPISRAKAAIGQAQREFSKINSFVEAEADSRKPPGAWKNMGTPFLSGKSHIVVQSVSRHSGFP